MRTIAEFDESQAWRHVSAAASIGAHIPVAWAEPFDDFCLFLEDCGIAVEGLPAWAPATAVMVVASPTDIWVKRITRAERRRSERLAAKGKAGLAIASLHELNAAPWVHLDITGVDPTKAAGRWGYICKS
jgi:hypothetical protein